MLNYAEKSARIAFIREEMTGIQAQLSKLRLQSVQSYSVNDGQFSQSATKKRTSELKKELDDYVAELSKLLGGGNGYIR